MIHLLIYVYIFFVVEATHAMLEQVAYWMSTGHDSIEIGKTVALLKVQATDTMELCAREASQILGGASYLRQGTQDPFMQ
tara:strand:- start:182 stop:421 length:240 start_codon:yes stop_codon:yes gene_type:complete